MFEAKTKPSSAATYNSPYNSAMSSVLGIQGQALEVTVVACNKLKDTEWISRQDPYVCLEYASTKYRTRTCTDGGKNPTFQERYVFTLIEGLREINIVVWNSNTLTHDDFIGSGKVQLHKVLSQGYDDSSWPLQDKRGRHGGEVRLIMHYANANGPASSHVPSVLPYSTPTPHVASHYPPITTSYTTTTTLPNNHQYPSYPPSSSTAYPPSYSTAYPPSSSTTYPPLNSQPYHHHQTSVAYPPTYPPQSNVYPPPSASDPYSTYHPPSLYPPHPYPPPPY